jgi:hypothetical protein
MNSPRRAIRPARSPGAARRPRSRSGCTYFAEEVHNAAEIGRGAEPKIRDQERTLAERLISELSATEFQPENYEDEYRKRLLKAIEQKVAGQEIERVEVGAKRGSSGRGHERRFGEDSPSPQARTEGRDAEARSLSGFSS